ncbi:hypothetical protein U9M48_006810 [Paspalum notatum var. saurae]|uniref:Uncharacterized protein n=1 Tax=Paspalum notatum var. saurae TaxID=547442 RepID=A0AAQ3PYR0_PASNO
MPQRISSTTATTSGSGPASPEIPRSPDVSSLIESNIVVRFAIALSGMANETVTPKCSDMSTPFFSAAAGSFHSNRCSKVASMRCTIRSASGMPGHILRPDPNGRSSKYLPRKSISVSRNLSGMNFSGSSHASGSRPIAHTFTRTRAPLGTV